MKLNVNSYFVVILIICIKNCLSDSVQKDLTLTFGQKVVLDKFKERVLPRLPLSYQRQDIYLIRWLRARNFNIPQAEEMLMKNLRWREKLKLDTIHEEDWSDFYFEYPYSIDGFDREGKPIITANLEEWDLRRGVVSGQADRLSRWLMKMIDEAVAKVRDLQARGQNVTQYDFIFNINNFNLVQHGCLQCLPIYLNFVSNYESYFPGAADKIILINTPSVFEIVLNLVRPVMSQMTKDALKIFNTNKYEWESFLFQDIDRDQLPETYGGTKPPKFDRSEN